jgi:hypothetical protein
MPECAAHTNVQRALHALILDDNVGAAGYLRRALCCLEEDGGVGKRKRSNNVFSLSRDGSASW